MMALDGGRIGISSQAIGIARAALEESVQYAKDRKQFDKPISEFQATQWKLADMATELDAAHLLAMRAAWLKGQSRPFSREASMAKVFATEAANRICKQGGPDPRRLRLHPRVRGRAPPARRAGHDDLRRNERGSADRDRAQHAS